MASVFNPKALGSYGKISRAVEEIKDSNDEMRIDLVVQEKKN